MSMENKYNSILNKYFGYKELKPKQFEIINKIVNEKRDVSAILATGFGKSICYQLPYLITGKNVIIVSPLLSLMEDQKNKLEKLNIPVCCLNSNCKNKNQIINDILRGNNKIIFITPEYLVHCEIFLMDLESLGTLALIAIDEAHCVSVWGNDFRESYKKLDNIRKIVPSIPILAMTATASLKVRDDISKQLKLNNPHVVVGSFDRPNLYISVQHTSSNIRADIEHLLHKFPNDYSIIYCKTRDDTDKIAEIVNSCGIKCYSYHAGLTNYDRTMIQKKFIDGEYKCIVATIAFGMGIDIPNIRLVIHYGCSKNIESYYQEIGRAGRDSKNSECYLFFSSKDFTLNRTFANDIKNDREREYQLQQIKIIEKFVYTNDCRRKFLLEAFNEVYKSNECNNCDNCLKKKSKTIQIQPQDFTDQAFKIIGLIHTLEGNFGSLKYINILRGSEAKNVINYKNNIFYGKGMDQSINWWKAFIRLLINEDYLEERGIKSKKFMTLLNLTKKSIKWITFNKKSLELPKIILIPSEDMLNSYKNTQNNLKTNDSQLSKQASKNKNNKIIDFKSSKNNFDTQELEYCGNDNDNFENNINYNDYDLLNDNEIENSKSNLKYSDDINDNFENDASYNNYDLLNDYNNYEIENNEEIQDNYDLSNIKEKTDNKLYLWSEIDDKNLLKDIQNNKSIAEIARDKNRTNEFIRNRLNTIAHNLINIYGISAKEVIRVTRLKDYYVNELIEKKEFDETKNFIDLNDENNFSFIHDYDLDNCSYN
jgi:ATP-dependent DNA helicase, RecQ family